MQEIKELETFSALRVRAKDIVRNLNWQVYHTPENLTLFLVGEAAELGEYCQWLSTIEINQHDLTVAVSDEIADVIKSVLYLANVLPLAISLETLLIKKLELDETEYPIEKFKGKSRYQIVKNERRKNELSPIPEDSLPYTPSIAEIQRSAWIFVKNREWDRFYSPASIALAITVKSGEVATCFQRRPKPIRSPYERLIWALADILLNAIRLCELMDIQDAFQMVRAKLDNDEKRFRYTQ